jgi:hypothetical protein
VDEESEQFFDLFINKAKRRAGAEKPNCDVQAAPASMKPTRTRGVGKSG